MTDIHPCKSKPFQKRKPHVIKQTSLYSIDIFPTDVTSPVPQTSPVSNLGVIFNKKTHLPRPHHLAIWHLLYMRLRDLRQDLHVVSAAIGA